MSILVLILVGLVAGFLAGKIMKGRGFGLVVNILVGIGGALVGGFLARALGIYTTGMIGAIITATAGAVVLLFIVSFFKK